MTIPDRPRSRKQPKKDEDQTILEMVAMKEKPSESLFALCIENSECEDLEKRKIYQILPDAEAS